MLNDYRVSVAGYSGGVLIAAKTRGQAKSRLFNRLDGDFPFTSLRARKMGPATTPEHFLDVARYRNVPWARIGDRVLVGGKLGVIVGCGAF